MKSIYTYYKERLIEISGKNRSLYIRSFGKKTGYDLGRIFSADPARAEEFFDFLWSGGRDKYTVISPEIASLKKILTPEDAAERKTARAKQPFAAALEKEISDKYDALVEYELEKQRIDANKKASALESENKAALAEMRKKVTDEVFAGAFEGIKR